MKKLLPDNAGNSLLSVLLLMQVCRFTGSAPKSRASTPRTFHRPCDIVQNTSYKSLQIPSCLLPWVPFLLYQPSTYEVADIIGTYVYREGLLGADYSYSTAVGLFNSFIGLLLVCGSNSLSKKFTESGLW